MRHIISAHDRYHSKGGILYGSLVCC
jgi:hypothetical protein